VAGNLQTRACAGCVLAAARAWFLPDSGTAPLDNEQLVPVAVSYGVPVNICSNGIISTSCCSCPSLDGVPLYAVLRVCGRDRMNHRALMQPSPLWTRRRLA